MPQNLISLKQLRQNELTDFVNGLLATGLSTVSGVSGVQGISGIYSNYNAGYITIGFTGARVTGSNPLSNFNFTGIGGLEVILSGNNILISGNTSTTSTTRFFTTGIATGVESQWITFSPLFLLPPVIQTTVSVPNFSNDMYYTNISGITTSGFHSVYSDVISQSGYILNVIAG